MSTSPELTGSAELTAPSNSVVTVFDWLVASVSGLVLAAGVWWGLLTGGGLNGGDTYPYFMPQKLILAESLTEGEIPLWHPLTALGYPLHAESQAGVFYPSNQILYRQFEINTAYNTSIVLHYWLAFVFCWRFARCQGLPNSVSWLVSIIYVYGWFPARISLEWSIIGGLWLPLTLWLTDRFIERPSRRRVGILAGCLGIHLLAGHFALAFINQLTIVAYALLRSRAKNNWPGFWRCPLLASAAVALGLGTAAIQLVPTYELKVTSQRHGAEREFDPAYGHMPPVYATQAFASWWYWHSPEVVKSKKLLQTPGAIDADTNPVEAHFYWGLIPLLLIFGLLNRKIRAHLDRTLVCLWLILMFCSLLYATGWLMPLSRHLPGFSFFMGPGRYTIIVQLAGAVLAGLVLTGITQNWKPSRRTIGVLLIGCVTLFDVLYSSKYVADAVVVAESPMLKIDDSWVRNLLGKDRMNHRLLAPGPNIGNLFGVSCLPRYLGLGPAIYDSEEFTVETGPGESNTQFPSQQSVAKLSRLGVTHILTTEPLQKLSPSIREVQQYPDALLNRIWGRGYEPCYLYELVDRPARVVAAPESALTATKVKQVSANSVEFDVTLEEDAQVELKELMYPGWQVSIDGVEVAATTDVKSPMRRVAVSKGTHSIRWHFSPRSFQVGVWVSVCFSVLLTLIVCWPQAQRTTRHTQP